MNRLIGRFKFFIVFAVLITLTAGCNKPQTNSQETSKKNSAENKQNKSDVPASNASSNDGISKINSGLLLGLMKDKGADKNVNLTERTADEYRTLWIYEDNNKKLICTEKQNGIITPYKTDFWKLENKNFVMSEPSTASGDKTGNVFQDYSSYYNFSNIVSQLAAQPAKDLFTKESFTKTYLNNSEGNLGGGFRADTEALLYVGNKYACVINNNYETGGGTFHFGGNYVKMYDISYLGNLEARNKITNLVDLLSDSEKSKLREYSNKYNKIISSNNLTKQEQKINIDNLSLKRVNGHWKVQVPLYNVFDHFGNGSHTEYIAQYIDTDINLPSSITCYDTLCVDWNTIKQKIPQAKDAVSSPNKDMLAVLTPTELLIFTDPVKGIDKPSLSVAVDKDESIILNQWATGEYVGKWNKSLNTYN